MNNENILVLTADESEALAGITTVTGVAVGIIAIVVIIAIIISFIMGRRLMRPLVKVSTIIEDVANGNIEADFSVVKESNDEIGDYRKDEGAHTIAWKYCRKNKKFQ